MEHNIYDSIRDILEVKQLLHEYVKTISKINKINLEIYLESEKNEICKKYIDIITGINNDNKEIINRMENNIYSIIYIIMMMYNDHIKYDPNKPIGLDLFEAKINNFNSLLLKINVDINNKGFIKEILAYDTSREEIMHDTIKDSTSLYLRISILLNKIEMDIKYPNMDLQKFKDIKQLEDLYNGYKENAMKLYNIINDIKSVENKNFNIEYNILDSLNNSIDFVQRYQESISYINCLMKEIFSYKNNNIDDIIEHIEYLIQQNDHILFNKIQGKLNDIIKKLTEIEGNENDIIKQLTILNTERYNINKEINEVYNKIKDSAKMINRWVRETEVINITINLENDIHLIKKRLDNIEEYNINKDLLIKAENINSNLKILNTYNNMIIYMSKIITILIITYIIYYIYSHT